MRYHRQLYGHDPKNGVWGDCFRTAIACLLDMEPEGVPHFMEDLGLERPQKDVLASVRPWLAERGFQLFWIAFHEETIGDLADMLEWIEVANPGMRVMLSGRTSRADHVVIVKDGKVEWDPATSDGSNSLIGPSNDGHWIIEWIARPPEFL